MTIEDTLRSELRAATAAHTASPALDRTLSAGRTRRRRTTAAKALAATGLACLLVVVATAVTGSDAPTRGDELVLAVPPEDLNGRIASLVLDRLPPGAQVADVRMRAYGPDPVTDPATAEAVSSTDGPEPLPREDWDQAVSWDVAVVLGPGHEVSVSLFHAGSETEGDPFESCRQDLRDDIYLACDVSVDAAGVASFTRLSALVPVGSSSRAGWYVVQPEDIRDPGRLHFEQQGEVHPGGDFLVVVRERVRAPEEGIARRAFVLSEADLLGIARDDDLLRAGTG
jgi:hypothetical protein